MGVLSDSFKARLTEMKQRHAEEQRQIDAARAELLQALAEMQAAATDLADSV